MIMVVLFRKRGTLEVQDLDLLKRIQVENSLLNLALLIILLPYLPVAVS